MATEGNEDVFVGRIERQLVMLGGEWYTQLWSPEELRRMEK